MRHYPFVDRMEAAKAEVRADSREFNWCSQERLAHRLPIGRVIVRVTMPVGVENCPIGVSLVHELGSEDAAETDELTVDVLFLEDEIELVPLADLQHEVDVPLEDLCQSQSDLVIETELLGCDEERLVDNSVPIRCHTFRLTNRLLSGEAIGPSLKLQGLQSRGDVLHADEDLLLRSEEAQC